MSSAQVCCLLISVIIMLIILECFINDETVTNVCKKTINFAVKLLLILLSKIVLPWNGFRDTFKKCFKRQVVDRNIV